MRLHGRAFVLHPGEEVRTPRVLLLCWSGDRMRGHNLLRRFILKHHRPHPDGWPLVAPLCNGNWRQHLPFPASAVWCAGV